MHLLSGRTPTAEKRRTVPPSRQPTQAGPSCRCFASAADPLSLASIGRPSAVHTASRRSASPGSVVLRSPPPEPQAHMQKTFRLDFLERFGSPRSGVPVWEVGGEMVRMQVSPRCASAASFQTYRQLGHVGRWPRSIPRRWEGCRLKYLLRLSSPNPRHLPPPPQHRLTRFPAPSDPPS